MVARAGSGKQTVMIEGRKLSLSSLDRVMYASTGTTKADIIDYYRQIAPIMLPHIADRPVTRKRWPRGVDAEGKGEVFFQKNLGEGAPEWLNTREIQHSDHVNTYPLANDLATLVWLAQLSSLELHVPQWRFDGDGHEMPPDRLVLDLDPGDGVGLRECAEVAMLIRRILEGMGLPAVPVTSGSKGIHLYAPLDGSVTSKQASAIAKELATSLEADYPDDIISKMKRSARAGKVFIDWSQNSASKTTIAPYSLRGRAQPMVAVPRTWRELASPHLKHLDYLEVLRRVKRRGDPLQEITSHTSTLRDRLTVYRSMRDASKTPEPVPEEPPLPRASVTDAVPVFVIQKHEARALHYDVRFERDGVFVSWAVPKGLPTTPSKNHLAVPTEDHPMEYRFFEGTIPKGEYGAGEVRIWDSGTITYTSGATRKSKSPCTEHPTAGWAVIRSPSLCLRLPSLTRNGKDVTSVFPELHNLGDAFATTSALLDGEIVSYGTNGVPDFSKLQHRLGVTDPQQIPKVMAEAPVSFIAFDLLHLNGIDMAEMPYDDRREILLSAFDHDDDIPLDVPEAFVGDAGTVDTAIDASRSLGLEGVVAKRRNSVYQAGSRSSDWLKVPFVNTIEVKVIGWRESQAEPGSFASLLVATEYEDGLTYAGRVGTGFSGAEKQRILKQLTPLTRKTPPAEVPASDRRDAHWVTPKITADVAYREITPSGKLRHPVWRGIRIDR